MRLCLSPNVINKLKPDFLYHTLCRLNYCILTEKEYIGCYEDQSERTLPYERIDLEGTMNNDICASHCCSALDGATFSGTEVNSHQVTYQITSRYS